MQTCPPDIRTAPRHYYRALGYTQDYIWTTFDDVPFSQPAKPLWKCAVVLITAASWPISTA